MKLLGIPIHAVAEGKATPTIIAFGSLINRCPLGTRGFRRHRHQHVGDGRYGDRGKPNGLSTIHLPIEKPQAVSRGNEVREQNRSAAVTV